MKTLPAPGWLELYETHLSEWDCLRCGEHFGIWEAMVPIDSRLDGPGTSPMRAWLLAVDKVINIRCPTCNIGVFELIRVPDVPLRAIG